MNATGELEGLQRKLHFLHFPLRSPHFLGNQPEGHTCSRKFPSASVCGRQLQSPPELSTEAERKGVRLGSSLPGCLGSSLFWNGGWGWIFGVGLSSQGSSLWLCFEGTSSCQSSFQMAVCFPVFPYFALTNNRPKGYLSNIHLMVGKRHRWFSLLPS